MSSFSRYQILDDKNYTHTCDEFNVVIANFTNSLEEGTDDWIDLVDEIIYAEVEICSAEQITALQVTKAKAVTIKVAVIEEKQHKEREVEQLEEEKNELIASLQTTVGKLSIFITIITQFWTSKYL